MTAEVTNELSFLEGDTFLFVNHESVWGNGNVGVWGNGNVGLTVEVVTGIWGTGNVGAEVDGQVSLVDPGENLKPIATFGTPDFGDDLLV